VVQYAAPGTQQTKSTQVANSAGTFNTTSVETQKSDRPNQTPEKPTDKPSPKP
jgi:hypothetical protein